MLLAASFAVLLISPGLFLELVSLLALYLVARVLLLAVFYFVGLVRIRQAAASAHANASATATQAAGVHHVVIVPSFCEPIDLLARTLLALAVQKDAHLRLTVVLAMEEAEAGAWAKAQQLEARFAGRFARLLVTFHPAGLPGELPGKASNLDWAARQARLALVDRGGTPIETLTLTSCDADSLIHPSYFAELTRRFAGDPERHTRFWQAPMRFDTGIWEAPAPVRTATLLNNALLLSQLATPGMFHLPLSTYTLSYKLADDAGYWDGMVIAEDYHMFLRCFFAAQGRVRLDPIFLPTTGNAVGGDSSGQTLRSTFQQAVRHAWGCQDVGYILQQWRRSPGVLRLLSVRYFLKFLHDHVAFSAAPFILAAGALLALASTCRPILMWPSTVPLLSVVSHWGYGLGLVGLAGVWAVEHGRCARQVPGWRPAKLVGEMLLSLVVPVLLVALGVPVLYAQTKMMLGSELIYITTPKKEGAGIG